MLTETAGTLMRHRRSIGEAGLLVASLSAIAGLLLMFDLTGALSSDQRIELVELFLLGTAMIGGMGFFSWRRIFDQEREIKARRVAEEHARHLAHHDHLTGLPNRRQLQSALDAAVAIPPSSERAHAVLLLDLNGFKKVNDMFGHARGDEVLSIIARRLSSSLRTGDLLARTGGDEFAMIVRDIGGLDGAASVARHIGEAMDAPISIGSSLHRLGTGIGIAMIPGDGLDAAELLRKADVALYKAKSAEGPGFAFYQSEMDREAHEREILQRDLAKDIGTDALVPHYQPIVDLKTGAIRSFEALARWAHPTLGSIPPDRFIPLAEDNGLIRDLTDRLLRRAFEDARGWPSDIGLSFNLSPVSLHDPTFALRIAAIANETKFSLDRLELEITENAVVRDFETARETLGAIRAAGIRIALDDFGTGSTSLFHLRSFKFDRIKVDRSFIDLMMREPESAAIVKAILGLGKGLDMDIVAEGVEQSSQGSFLLEQGCSLGQGFLFSRAVPAAETLQLLDTANSTIRAAA